MAKPRRKLLLLSLLKGLYEDEVGPWDDDGAKDICQLQPLDVTSIMVPRLVELVLPFSFGSAPSIVHAFSVRGRCTHETILLTIGI